MEFREQLISRLDIANTARVYNINRSITIAQEVLEESEENLDIKAKSLSQLSLYNMIIGNNEVAMQYAQDSIAIYEALQDEKGIADSKYSLAGVYYKTNNYHIGLVFLIDALNIYTKHEDYYNISRCEKSLGTVYEYSGDQVNAIQSYENAIAAAKKINDLNLESNAYNNLSGVHIKNGNIALANKLIKKSIAIKKKTGDVRGLAFAIYGKAKVFFAKKDYDKAILKFQKAISIHTEMGERLGLAMSYHKLAKLYVEIENFELAKENLEKAIAITEQYSISIVKFKCYYTFYTLHKLKQNETESLKYLELYIHEKENVINTQTLKVIESYDMLVKMKTMQKEAELQKEKAEMQEKNNRAEEAVRVRQEFLSTMSHEIRTPLNAITTIVSMMDEKQEEDHSKLISSLKFSSNLLMWIINDILDFTKLDLGKMKLELNPVSLENLMDNIWKTYQHEANNKGLNFLLHSDIAPNTSYFLDETRITQILGNLLNNAVKFTDEGEIGLSIKLIKRGKTTDNYQFKIKDTGEGIAKENLDTIFDSFSQVKNLTTRKNGGTGLGLTIVKNLLELHGSNIKVKSEPGEGTEFSFVLKLKKAEAQEAKPPLLSTESLEGKVVLLAEDNSINAFIAIKLLSNWGIITDHAINGLQAVQKAQENQYDYILMDIHMPEMDGFEASKKIRNTEQSQNKNTPIFGLTADISAKDNEKFNHYFNDFLLKPLQIEKLHLAFNSLV